MKGSGGKQGAGGSRRTSAAGARSDAATSQGEATVRYRTLLESLDTAVLLMRGAECVDCNPATLTLFGLSSRDEILGKKPFDFAPPKQPGGRDSAEMVRESVELALKKGLHIFEWQAFRRSGERFIMEVRFTPYRIGQEQYFQCIAIDITERKRAEQELAEREALLRQIQDTASVAIFLVDKQGRITHANRRMAEMFACPVEELIGSEYVAHVHPAEREIGRQKMLDLLASKIPSVSLERFYWRKDGTEFWGHLVGRRFHDVHGKELGLIGVITDITERKQAEEARRQSEEKFRLLVETSYDWIWEVDSHGVYTYASPRVRDLLGYAPDEVVGKTPFDLMPPEERERVTDVFREIVRRREPLVGLENTNLHKDGRRVVLETSGLPIFNDAGEFKGYRGIDRDITYRKQAEASLRESESRTRSIIESTPVGMHMYRLEPGGRLVFSGANPAADRILGVDNRIFVGKTIEEAFPPLAETEVPRRYREVVETGMTWQTESIEYRDDAIVGAFEVHAFRTGPDSVVAAFEDVTERKRMEEALRASEERFRNLAESLPLTVFETDLQGRFTYVNRAACETFGYTQQDMYAGLTMSEVISPADRERARMVMARRVAGDLEGYVEYEGLRKDGTTFPITVASSPIIRDGRPAGLRGIVSDLTERRALDEERLKTQKLESIGTLAGGIAHDFNNLMQGVFGYIAMAKLTHDQREKSLAMLEQAEKALHQSVSLTSQLLTFSKGGKPLKKATDLRPVVEDAARFALSGSRVRAEMLFADDLWPADADAGQIGQVVQNLVLNADQAMPEGGVVSVSVGNAAASGQPHGLAAGKYVRIAIQDSGVGIPEQYLAKIFDPYFTTKEKGSGLGLATSYSIVRNHGGIIEVSSEPEKGSVFSVYLPAASAAPGQSASPPGTGAVRKGRVLVMDDEELVRRVAYEMLTGLGHTVELAGHGEEAVERYRQAQASGRPFAVVILDLTVRGGMGGAETVQLLRELDPAVRAVVSSGYSDDAVIADHREHGFQAYLKKPYDIEDLRRTLQELIG